MLVSLWNSLSPSWLREKRFCPKDTLSVARAERWATDFALTFHATVIRVSPSAFQAQPVVKIFFSLKVWFTKIELFVPLYHRTPANSRHNSNKRLGPVPSGQEVCWHTASPRAQHQRNTPPCPHWHSLIRHKNTACFQWKKSQKTTIKKLLKPQKVTNWRTNWLPH